MALLILRTVLASVLYLDDQYPLDSRRRSMAGGDRSGSYRPVTNEAGDPTIGNPNHEGDSDVPSVVQVP